MWMEQAELNVSKNILMLDLLHLSDRKLTRKFILFFKSRFVIKSHSLSELLNSTASDIQKLG